MLSQMCTIELYEIVHPDGTREPGEQLVNCRQGTPSQPCRNTQRRNTFEERPAVAERRTGEIRGAAGPRYNVNTHPGSERPRSRREDRERPKGLFASLFEAFKPGSSKSVKPNGKKVFVKNRRKLPLQDNRPATVYYPPRAPTPPQYYSPQAAEPAAMPNRPLSPEIIPIEPRRKDRHREPDRRPRERDREPRPQRRTTRPVDIHHAGNHDDSSSPPKASRRHQRKSRSLSPVSRYEAEKREVLERERRQHEERVARQEQDARERAIRLERYERRERAREEAQRRIEFEERRRIESAERARRRQEQEDRERDRARDRARDQERDQARARQEREDIDRIRAAERARRLREENNRRAEQERLDRLRGAGIPRRPRQEPAVRYGENMGDRGERFIRESIERERRRPPMAYNRYAGDGLRRRNTVDGVPRRSRYGEERPWHSR
ncbi:hypothetical protein OEA41_008269 [Lepraria neglecta]|uniref:Uncharacterized protein n=1 Tax=Lepraria neglecta TaxID=209136 RepID=A0AAD9ZEC0_9LECA|nr:hypothetical protein OEA41_008269 [Lepraria neglecta]